MKYEVRNEIPSRKRLNYRNATDHVSVFKATGKLHAMPNSGEKKVYYLTHRKVKNEC